MEDAFAAASEKFEQSLKSDASPAVNDESSTAPVEQSMAPDTSSAPTQKEVAQAILELDKVDKFKFAGQEWTAKDLQAAIMRQKDYTLKTQELAKERESFGSERKFYENLAWDLKELEKNPALIHEFVKVYPQKFHQYAEAVFKQANQGQAQSQVPQGVQQSQPDVQLLSRLSNLEKFYHDQEVAKNEQAIKQTMDDLTKKYPETDKKLAKETILARAHEMYMVRDHECKQRGIPTPPLDSETWETIFKDVASEVKEFAKAEYGDLVKKQTEANQKGKDVGPGGGIAGRAPQKFKNFDEIQKFAEATAKG